MTDLNFSSSENLELEERFTSALNKKSHFYKHFSKKHITPEEIDEYERQADELASTPVDYQNILGFEVDHSRFPDEADSGRKFVKYNKQTGLFVVYAGINLAGEPIIISAYHMSWREFTGKRAVNYLGEIPVPEYQRDWDFRFNPKDELIEI